MNNAEKKYGRRKAGTWGRPRRGNKTVAARAIRRLFRNLKKVHGG